MTLKTARLTIEPLRENEDDALADILLDERVSATYLLPPLPTREDAIKLSVRLRMLSCGEKYFVRGIYLDDTLVGMINDTGCTDGSIELGYVIAPAYWNRGYATEAFSAVMDAMLAGGLREVVAGAFESNLASIRVMQKCGMTLTGRRATVEYCGELYRCVYYSKRST